ncbi:hypothetical protein VCHA37P191_120155 [Vibrio chagasii]|nr:hypothetical protein VCHA37P191_120155 [Vibrio chagasii]CAH6962706.1 hypothetical protein VCHA49P380_130155 [Vibrio chagasii]
MFNNNSSVVESKQPTNGSDTAIDKMVFMVFIMLHLSVFYNSDIVYLNIVL